jgi:hypothetical protein
MEITTQIHYTIGIGCTNAGSPSQDPPIVMDEVSPCISEYESEGFLSCRKSNSKQALAKKGIFQRANPTTVPSKKAVLKQANSKMLIVKRADITSAKTSNSSDDE